MYCTILYVLCYLLKELHANGTWSYPIIAHRNNGAHLFPINITLSNVHGPGLPTRDPGTSRPHNSAPVMTENISMCERFVTRPKSNPKRMDLGDGLVDSLSFHIIPSRSLRRKLHRPRIKSCRNDAWQRMGKGRKSGSGVGNSQPRGYKSPPQPSHTTVN
jgi:hypothetical protein